MRWLYFILRGYSLAVSGLCIWFIVAFIVDRYRSSHHTDIKSIKIYQIFIVVAILSSVFISSPFQELIKLYNIDFKPEGEYCYYVIIENEYGTDKETVPARVELSIENRNEEGMYGESRSAFILHYYLKEVYFADKTLVFEEDNEIAVNKAEPVCDKDIDFWICTLLNEKAYYPSRKFDNGITAYNIIILTIKLLALFCSLIMLEIDKRKYRKGAKTWEDV